MSVLEEGIKMCGRIEELEKEIENLKRRVEIIEEILKGMIEQGVKKGEPQYSYEYKWNSY